MPKLKKAITLAQRVKNKVFISIPLKIKLPFKKSLGEGLIFIVGMPRSGTTLIESIIASAPDTISGGELISFYDLIYDLNHNLTKEEKLTVVELLWQTALADDYLDIEEEKIIKRASDLMGINPSLVLQLKHKALNQS